MVFLCVGGGGRRDAALFLFSPRLLSNNNKKHTNTTHKPKTNHPKAICFLGALADMEKDKCVWLFVFFVVFVCVRPPGLCCSCLCLAWRRVPPPHKKGGVWCLSLSEREGQHKKGTPTRRNRTSGPPSPHGFEARAQRQPRLKSADVGFCCVLVCRG